MDVLFLCFLFLPFIAPDFSRILAVLCLNDLIRAPQAPKIALAGNPLLAGFSKLLRVKFSLGCE